VKFLVDVGVGKSVEDFLKESGFDVKAVRDIDPKSKDLEILKIAVSEKRMIITMDKDFGDLVYHSGQKHSGILLLRLEAATGAQKVTAVNRIIRNFKEAINNRFCVFQGGRLRIKGLKKVQK
jgi:predicted nuclease of predicted toxin-antitoxin system